MPLRTEAATVSTAYDRDHPTVIPSAVSTQMSAGTTSFADVRPGNWAKVEMKKTLFHA